MGCFNSKDRKFDCLHRTDKDSSTLNDPKLGFQVSASDFIIQKQTKFSDEYEIKEQIGKGSFGTVWRIQHKASGLIRAVKIVKKKEMDELIYNELKGEVATLRTLDHPNILKIFELFEENGKLYIISEILKGDELFERINEIDQFSENDAAIIMQQVLSAVSYCHKHNIVHRDLKPENLVYESNTKEDSLKVIDFGNAREFTSGIVMTRILGSIFYIAPEVLKGQYTEKCDIWSCGVILYMILVGSPPFTGKNASEVISKVKQGKIAWNSEVWENISEEAKTLISRMMEINPEKRYSAQEALDDPWFKKVSNQKELSKKVTKENLNKLRSFRYKSKMQQILWVYLASHLTSGEEKEKLLETFKAIDTDGDGQLTREELREGYKKTMGMSHQRAEQETETVFETLDANNSNTIDYSEFVNATISSSLLLTKKKVKAAFALLDKDGDGKISLQELKAIMDGKKSMFISEKVWKNWIKQIDKDGDGQISLKEFAKMMSSYG